MQERKGNRKYDKQTRGIKDVKIGDVANLDNLLND